MAISEQKPNIVCLGLSHHSAPVEVRERFAVSPPRIQAALDRFRSIEGVSEALILSTCNRVEFYAAGEELRAGYHAFDQFLREHSGMESLGLDTLYRYDFPHSATHLFRVVSGLDSMVVGETEITGQVKQAYKTASQAGATSRLLNKLFQRAFQVAKHIRTKTGINKGAVSVGSVAVDLAGKIFGDLSRCRVMILGAGENSERTARSLLSRGVRDVRVANRSIERAQALAASLNGMAVPLDNWQSEIDSIDILIASTAAPHPIIDRKRLEPLLASRAERPLFLIDIAVPRDVHPDVNALDNVYLYDIDSLEAIANMALNDRRIESDVCQRLIEAHVAEFAEWLECDFARRRGAAKQVACEGGEVFTEGVRV